MRNGQREIQKLLTERFNDLRSVNSRYSLRAFAGKIGLAPGALSGILNGKRTVSKKMAERIALRLLLDPGQTAALISHFDESTKIAPNPKMYLELAANEFKLVADWEHKAILSLLKTRSRFQEPSEIAARLDVSQAVADQAIKRLLNLGLIKVNRAGFYQRTVDAIKTTDNVSDSAIKRSHEQSLDLAKRSLFEVSVRDRDVRSITMPINPDRIEEARKLIDEFQDRLSDLLEAGPATEVYRFTTALFPLTKLESEGKNK